MVSMTLGFMLYTFIYINILHIHIYKQILVLNNAQELRFHKTQPNQIISHQG